MAKDHQSRRPHGATADRQNRAAPLGSQSRLVPNFDLESHFVGDRRRSRREALGVNHYRGLVDQPAGLIEGITDHPAARDRRLLDPHEPDRFGDMQSRIRLVNPLPLAREQNSRNEAVVTVRWKRLGERHIDPTPRMIRNAANRGGCGTKRIGPRSRSRLS